MKLRCIAVDDEPLALMQIAKYAERMPRLELVGTFHSGTEAMGCVREGGIDLMFLDIEMPDFSGLEVAAMLADAAPLIVFTTAWPQYALEGYRLDVVDYLLKPLDFGEMQTAVEKALRRKTADARNAEHEIFVKADGVMHRLSPAEILYIKGLGEYVRIFLKDRKHTLTSLISMKSLEAELEPQGFMRLHKSYLVNLALLDRASRTHVVIGGEKIPVGKKAQPDFLKYLKSRIPGR